MAGLRDALPVSLAAEVASSAQVASLAASLAAPLAASWAHTGAACHAVPAAVAELAWPTVALAWGVASLAAACTAAQRVVAAC